MASEVALTSDLSRTSKVFPLIPLLKREVASLIMSLEMTAEEFPLIPLLKREVANQGFRSKTNSINFLFPLIPLLKREVAPVARRHRHRARRRVGFPLIPLLKREVASCCSIGRPYNISYRFPLIPLLKREVAIEENKAKKLLEEVSINSTSQKRSGL